MRRLVMSGERRLVTVEQWKETEESANWFKVGLCSFMYVVLVLRW